MWKKHTTLPYQWRLDGNYLMGITSDRWWSLLRQHQFQIARHYWHRATAITLTSGLSCLLSQIESWCFAREVEAVEIVADPIFILGHWRSGTTLLHELLALDTEHLAYANTFQVMSPQTFLLTEEVCAHWFKGLVPHQRPMDNMNLGLRSPQEDEFAIALETLQSYYLALSFPAAAQYYERYLTLQALSAAERQQWTIGFLWFLKKLTFKYRRQLVLKSPPHTARIQHLLDLFPKARFIHIHRHPYEVFQSMQHYFDTAGWLTYLQTPDTQTRDRAILRRYRILYDAYFAQKSLIPAGQFCEVRFSALAADPIAQVQAIYDTLALPYTQEFEAKLHSYVTTHEEYRRNTFAPLAPEIQQHIDREWRHSFEAWGYRTH